MLGKEKDDRAGQVLITVISYTSAFNFIPSTVGAGNSVAYTFPGTLCMSCHALTTLFQTCRFVAFSPSFLWAFFSPEPLFKKGGGMCITRVAHGFHINCCSTTRRSGSWKGCLGACNSGKEVGRHCYIQRSLLFLQAQL